ncbi:hypothetical protein [Rhodopirellula sp. MGV]|uniref:hypothetical protein n=1 Tax=Rhodopirellula sp. MGV TaxID=2023130 RepID=UPI000B96EB2B|nr:hypothetical protein [Rhodopirellula sp. MGV]OYP34163.1 hypothetical protein CGZ80_16030 [Rhodopirellula sp. MGV]PNY33599.1 hypothetical protein C2E31_27755 [Rhodopirellula baltica]
MWQLKMLQIKTPGFLARTFAPLCLIAASFLVAPQAQAQTSIPLYTTSYSVQVEWYFWRSGGTYWATEFESDNYVEAELIYELFDAALESGTLVEILGGNISSWIPIDVRLRTIRHWNIDLLEPVTVNTTPGYNWTRQ